MKRRKKVSVQACLLSNDSTQSFDHQREIEKSFFFDREMTRTACYSRKKKQQSKWQIVESLKLIEKGILIVNKTVIEVNDCIKKKQNYLGIKQYAIFMFYSGYTAINCDCKPNSRTSLHG